MKNQPPWDMPDENRSIPEKLAIFLALLTLFSLKLPTTSRSLALKAHKFPSLYDPSIISLHC
jgi:hypothetical protein